MGKVAVISSRKCPHCNGVHASDKAIKACRKVQARKKGGKK